MPHEKHHRCNLCGKNFESGDELEDHVERRHPKRDVHWWVVAENPQNLPFEVHDRDASQYRSDSRRRPSLKFITQNGTKRA